MTLTSLGRAFFSVCLSWSVLVGAPVWAQDGAASGPMSKPPPVSPPEEKRFHVPPELCRGETCKQQFELGRNSDAYVAPPEQLETGFMELVNGPEYADTHRYVFYNPHNRIYGLSGSNGLSGSTCLSENQNGECVVSAPSAKRAVWKAKVDTREVEIRILEAKSFIRGAWNGSGIVGNEPHNLAKARLVHYIRVLDPQGKPVGKDYPWFQPSRDQELPVGHSYGVNRKYGGVVNVTRSAGPGWASGDGVRDRRILVRNVPRGFSLEMVPIVVSVFNSERVLANRQELLRMYHDTSAGYPQEGFRVETVKWEYRARAVESFKPLSGALFQMSVPPGGAS